MSNFSNQDSSLCPTYALTFLFHLSDAYFLLLATVVKPLEMGLSLSTMSLVCLLCAISKVLTTCTTIPLRSLEGLGYVVLFWYYFVFSRSFYSGAFDIPKAKCPPDRGSLDCVTGSPASFLFPSHLTDSPSSSPSSSPPSANSIPHTTIPRAIPRRKYSTSSTPPLTPDNGSDYHKGSDSIHEKDALDFLMTVFPHQGISVLPHAKSVSICAPNLGSEFNGVVLDIPGSTKTLYVDGKSAKSVSLRERWLYSLMCYELADIPFVLQHRRSVGSCWRKPRVWFARHYFGTIITKPWCSSPFTHVRWWYSGY